MRRHACSECGTLVDERKGRVWEARVEFISPDHKRRMPGGVVRLGYLCQEHAEEQRDRIKGSPSIAFDQTVMFA